MVLACPECNSVKWITIKKENGGCWARCSECGYVMPCSPNFRTFGYQREPGWVIQARWYGFYVSWPDQCRALEAFSVLMDVIDQGQEGQEERQK